MDHSTNTLPDVQALLDNRGLSLRRAGIKGLLLPISYLQHGEKVVLPTSVTSTVDLKKEERGVHMSRLVEQWVQAGRNTCLGIDLRSVLRNILRHSQGIEATCELRFVLFLTKQAPITNAPAPFGIDCRIHSALRKQAGQEESSELILSVQVPISNLCPCSRAMSSYGAHNQRALISASVEIDQTYLDETNPNCIGSDLRFFEELILQVEKAASSAVYPLLKRRDEKFVTDTQYENAKFVEDVIRDAIALVKELPPVKGFALAAEALESIHAHNAWSAHEENWNPLFPIAHF